MTRRFRLCCGLMVAGLVAVAASASAETVDWNFNTATLNGWTVLNGFETYNNNGVAAGDPNNNFGHDAAHANFVLASPVFTFTGNDDLGGAAISVTTFGGAGNQSASPPPVSPADVIDYNGGNSNSGGLKGAALFDAVTEQYVAVFYNPGNGNTNTQSANIAQLTGGVPGDANLAGGVNLNNGYQVHIFDNDDGGWGWTTFQRVQVDATLGGPVIPEPSTMLLSLMAFAALCGRWRRRRRS